MAKFCIVSDIRYCIEARPFLFPDRWMFTRPVDLKRKQFLFALEKPCTEPPHLVYW